MPNTVTCAACGHANGSEQRFCGGCGARLVSVCAGCGAANSATFRFCGECGAALGGPSAAPPREVAPIEARRWVSVLFADLSGFTRASEDMDPEDVTGMVDRCMSRLGEVVERFGGFVEKIIGDQIMCVFGAPTAHEDDAERAVRAALEMQQCATGLAEEMAGLGLRVGINTGEVMFAPVGPESARRFTVMGDVVNTASRLESAAPVGGVLVGEATWQAARRSIRFREVEPVLAKNKSEPVRAWVAEEALAATAERPRSRAPLIGREEELAFLHSLWRRVLDDRRPHVVTLIGAAGIGKSRLVQELVDLVGTSGSVLSGRSLPYGDSVGYGAFAQQVRSFATIRDTDAEDTAAGRLRAALDGIVDPSVADDVAVHLGLLLGLDASASADKAALFLSARRFLEGVARRSPILVVFEDVHCAAPVLLDLIESLAARMRDAPILLVCLARPELYDTRPQWGGGLRAFSAVELDALSADQSVVLAGHLVAALADIGASVDRLAEAAGGNPFFLEELVSSVAEGAAHGGSELPTSVRAIIAARLDALPAGARAVLLDAAVIGKAFWRSVLEQLEPGRDVDAALDLLETRHFIRRERSALGGDEETITFRHSLTRDVAYAMIPKTTRRARHGAVAEILLHASGSRPDLAAILAHHFREAGQPAEAVVHLEAAADAASRAWAKGEAIRLCAEALELVADDDHATRRRLRITRGRLLADSGDFGGALAELVPVLPELTGSDRMRALLTCTRSAFWSADVEAARRYADEAVGTARDLGGGRVLGPALGLRMLTTSLDGELAEGIEIGHEALPLLDEQDHPADRALLLTHIGLHHYWMGHHEEAAVSCRAAAELGAKVHDLDGALGGGAQLAMCLAAVGRIEEALSTFAAVRDQALEVELVPRHAGRTTSMWAGTLREIGDHAGARRLNEEAIELGQRAKFLNTLVQSAVDLLVLDLLTGDLGAVQQRLGPVAEQAEGLKGWHQWLVATRLLDVEARLLLELGQHAEAATAAQASAAKAARHGRLKYESSARRTLGAALLGLGDATGAAAQARRSLVLAQETAHLPTIWGAADGLRRAATAAGDEEEAARAAGVAVDSIERWAAGMDASRRPTFLADETVAPILDHGRMHQ